MTFNTRPLNPSFINEYKLDINNYPEEEQRRHLKKNIEQAILWYEGGIPTKLYGSPHLELRMFSIINQNWATIRQNELLLRQNERAEQQNERIIQLLEKLTGDSSTSAQSTCLQCNAACDNTAFCSQCGYKLAD